jgi:hypothetical protein
MMDAFTEDEKVYTFARPGPLSRGQTLIMSRSALCSPNTSRPARLRLTSSSSSSVSPLLLV